MFATKKQNSSKKKCKRVSVVWVNQQSISIHRRARSLIITQGSNPSIHQSVIIIFRRQHVHTHRVCVLPKGGWAVCARPGILENPLDARRRTKTTSHSGAQQRYIGNVRAYASTTSQRHLLRQRRCRKIFSTLEMPEEGQKRGDTKKKRKRLIKTRVISKSMFKPKNLFFFTTKMQKSTNNTAICLVYKIHSLLAVLFSIWDTYCNHQTTSL